MQYTGGAFLPHLVIDAQIGFRSSEALHPHERSKGASLCNSPPPGARIAGRYEVASKPLMGGMGIVYLCFDHQEQRPVALKTFLPEFLPDRAARDRFLHEGETWVRLGKHPHIVRCYDVFQDTPRPEVYLALGLIAK
jgi:hypothetical protein